MARDIVIDAEINPKVNFQELDVQIAALQKRLRSAKSGAYSKESDRIANLIQTLKNTGIVSSEIQGRRFLEKRMGGRFDPFQSSIFLMAQEKARTGYRDSKEPSMTSVFASASEAQEKIRNLRFLGREWAIRNEFEAFQQNPTQESATVVMGNIVALRRDLLKLYAEYRVNRRQVPQILRQIAQNTAALKKDVSDFDSGEPQSAGGGSSTGGTLKKIIGVASISSLVTGLIRKGGQGLVAALNRGAQAMRLQAAYGREVNWGDIRARSAVFNMSTESAAAPSQYASDFRQRMMWGEVSEREIIGLSRAGQWGRMVMSGEAARNPEKANAVFEKMVASTDHAQMRSILSQLGLPQDLMQYKIQGYSKETRAEYNQKFAEIADKEWRAAVMMFDAGNQYQLVTEQLSDAIAEVTGKGVQYMSAQGREFARSFGVFEGAGTPQAVQTQKTIERTADIATKLGLGPYPKIISSLTDVMLNPQQKPNATVNQTNYYTINGANEETAEMFGSKVDEATSKALYNAQVNSTPGAISGVGG